ncbi:MAG TPA: hypothetical protein VI114_09285 [Chthoniobacterales bacterium]
MTTNFKASKATDRQDDLQELAPGSSPHIIVFFPAGGENMAKRDQPDWPLRNRSQTKNTGFRRELLHPHLDPVEDWLHSLLGGAAVASLLIGIVCWPSNPAMKTERSKPREIAHLESSQVTPVWLNYEP